MLTNQIAVNHFMPHTSSTSNTVYSLTNSYVLKLQAQSYKLRTNMNWLSDKHVIMSYKQVAVYTGFTVTSARTPLAAASGI